MSSHDDLAHTLDTDFRPAHPPVWRRLRASPHVACDRSSDDRETRVKRILVMSEYIPLFTSPQTTRPVPYRSDIDRLALVRASLDADVTAIEPVPVSRDRPSVPGRVAMVRDRHGVFVSLRVVDHVGGRCATSADLAYARDTLTGLGSTLDMVFACRRRFVPAADQVRILHYLDTCGECALIEVAQATMPFHDGVTTVLSLVCRALVTIDLDMPLGPESRVRRRLA